VPGPSAVNWVITVTDIEIPKSRNSSTYPGPPLLQNTPQGTGSDWKNFPGTAHTDRQTPCLL